jgi:hypothetical protein
MGLLDTALGSFLNSGTTGDGQGALNQAIGSLLSQHGGIGGLSSANSLRAASRNRRKHGWAPDPIRR